MNIPNDDATNALFKKRVEEIVRKSLKAFCPASFAHNMHDLRCEEMSVDYDPETDTVFDVLGLQDISALTYAFADFEPSLSEIEKAAEELFRKQAILSLIEGSAELKKGTER